MLSYHQYAYWEWKTYPDLTPYQILEEKLKRFKQFNKPIIISEIGFPTFMHLEQKQPSNIGNTPYKLGSITKTTPETEELQKTYLAGMLHVIKENNVEGYIV